MYIWRYTSPNENFEYGYSHSKAVMQFELKLERCKLHDILSQIFDVIQSYVTFQSHVH